MAVKSPMMHFTRAALAALLCAPMLLAAMPANAQGDGPPGFTPSTGGPAPIMCAAWYYWVMSMATSADGGQHPPSIGTLLDQYAKWAGPVIDAAGPAGWDKAIKRLHLELDNAEESYNMTGLNAVQTLAAHYESPCDEAAALQHMDWQAYAALGRP